MTIKHAILTLDFEVDADGNPDAALEDILGAIRIALSGSTSIGAGAVELGAIVQSVEAVNKRDAEILDAYRKTQKYKPVGVPAEVVVLGFDPEDFAGSQDQVDVTQKLKNAIEEIKEKCLPVFHDYRDYSEDAYRLATGILELIEEATEEESATHE